MIYNRYTIITILYFFFDIFDMFVMFSILNYAFYLKARFLSIPSLRQLKPKFDEFLVDISKSIVSTYIFMHLINIIIYICLRLLAFIMRFDLLLIK